MITLVIAIVILAADVAGQPAPAAVVEAWADTAGPDGATWYLTIASSGNARVAACSGPGRCEPDREFTVALELLAAAVEMPRSRDFFSLPRTLGPPTIPLHGPSASLRITLADRTHQVFLLEPGAVRTDSVRRFVRIWRRVEALSPVPAPLKIR